MGFAFSSPTPPGPPRQNSWLTLNYSECRTARSIVSSSGSSGYLAESSARSRRFGGLSETKPPIRRFYERGEIALVPSVHSSWSFLQHLILLVFVLKEAPWGATRGVWVTKQGPSLPNILLNIDPGSGGRSVVPGEDPPRTPHRCGKHQHLLGMQRNPVSS